MLILTSVYSGLGFWLVNHTSVYENSELNIFKSIKFLGEICNNWTNDLFEMDVYKNLELCW